MANAMVSSVARCALIVSLAVFGTTSDANDGVLTFPGPSSTTSTAPAAPAPNSGTSASDGYRNAAYVCQAQDQSRISLRLDTGGAVYLNDPKTGESANGTYTYSGASFSLAVPAYQFNETTERTEAAKGLLLAFEMSSLYCWLLAHEVGEAVQGYVLCPKIKYVPSVGWQKNAFEFYQDHSVKWRRWDEYSALADTTYSETYGTYLIEGSQISMAFGSRAEERYLSGVIGSDYSVTINELEPDKGACRSE